jgi:hypothetical protein
VRLDAAQVGTRFRWGVRLEGPSGPNIWGIPTEIQEVNSTERYRAPYMYRITNAQGEPVFRTDLFSREQIGRGAFDPAGHPFAGDPSTLDGTKGCSLVRSIDTVAKHAANPRASGSRSASSGPPNSPQGSPCPAESKI